MRSSTSPVASLGLIVSARARHEPAGEGDDALHPDRFDLPEQRARGIDDALRDAVVVAQVDEQQIAVVALAVDPAGEPHRAAGIGKAELAAVMGSIGVHGTIRMGSRATGKPGGKRHFRPGFVKPRPSRMASLASWTAMQNPCIAGGNDPDCRVRRPRRLLPAPARGGIRRHRHRIHARQDLLAAALPGPDRRARGGGGHRYAGTRPRSRAAAGADGRSQGAEGVPRRPAGCGDLLPYDGRHPGPAGGYPGRRHGLRLRRCGEL